MKSWKDWVGLMIDDRWMFLDFDGVLNHHAISQLSYLKKHAEDDTLEFYSPDPLDSLDLGCVSVASSIRRTFNLDTVVSSTWRKRFTKLELRELLQAAHFCNDSDFLDVTPELHPCTDFERQPESVTRGVEIAAFLKKYSSREAIGVILDDDSDFGMLTPYLVSTSLTAGGLRVDHFLQARNILKSQERGWTPSLGKMAFEMLEAYGFRENS